MAFGVDASVASNLVAKIKKRVKKPIMVKLSPNVTSISEMAKAVEGAGADAVSLINTLVGMRIDIATAKPVLATGSGGYSGKGVFPVALKMIYDVKKAVSIPVVGMGGVSSAKDAVEMMMAGATAVMVGTQNLIDPYACKRIIEELPEVLNKIKTEKISDIIGRAQ